MPAQAFITSSGVELRNLLERSSRHNVVTRHGTVPVVTGSLNGDEVVSLIRSGSDTPVVPHKVNYRANMVALKELGVRRIIATSVVGGLNATLLPGAFVLMDQFLDFTRARGVTAYNDDAFRFMDFTEPYCPSIRQAVLASSHRLGQPVAPAGCYVGVDGPRYETAAEVRMYRMLGGDVIGMSNIPEAVFARELEMCYATVGVVANAAAGLTRSKVLIEEINKATVDASPSLLSLIVEAAGRLRDVSCECVPKTRVIGASPTAPNV